MNNCFLILCLLALSSSAQNLTCKDFKTGRFFIPNDNEMLNEVTFTSKDTTIKYIPEYGNTERYIIDRKDNYQLEWRNTVNNGEPEYTKIRWIDDCSYRLITIGSKEEAINQSDNYTNQDKGILVRSIRIDENCMLYKTTKTIGEEITISQKGMICKE